MLLKVVWVVSHEEDHVDVDGHCKGPPRIRLHKPERGTASSVSVDEKKILSVGHKSTYISSRNACVWHRAESSPASMPAYPIAQAILAPTFAIEAKRIKVLGTDRTRLEKPYVTKINKTPTKLREAPTLSTRTMVPRSDDVKFI